MTDVPDGGEAKGPPEEQGHARLLRGSLGGGKASAWLKASGPDAAPRPSRDGAASESAAAIARLHKLTRADMSDCRAALQAAEGDLDQALVQLRTVQISRLRQDSGKDEALCRQALNDAEGDMAKALNRLRTVDPEALRRQRVQQLLAPATSPDEAVDGLLALIWRHDLNDMNEAEKTVALVGLLRHHLEASGLQKYFFTMGERNLAETFVALEAIGAQRTRQVLVEAHRVVQGDSRETLETLDTGLSEDPEPLAALLLTYARDHQGAY